MGTTITKEKTHRPRVVAGLTPYAGTFDKEQITHLLKRTMFGATKADVDFFTGKTLTETINTLLTAPAALTDDKLPLNYYGTVANGVDPNVTFGSTWVYSPENGNLNGQRRTSIKAWWGAQMMNQTRSIFEKMVLFWHNHFSTEIVDTTALMFFKHLALLRANALGNFKTLTKEVTLDPNMLRYLNGYLNRKTAPDENYGRELQELFTVGKGPNSKYTEDDVKAAAKVLTGWSIRNVVDPQNPAQYKWESYFTPVNHDTTPKVFSAFYGNKTITTPVTNTQADASAEIDAMLDMIFATNETAMYVCRRIYRFFVYYDIDATVEAEVITPMADIFRQANYDIKPVLKALFSSEHFFDVAQKACLIKSPIEFAVGLVREFNMVFPTTITTLETDLPVLYSAWYTIVGDRNNGAATQGQNIGDPPNVSGWYAYYQVPVFHEAWINTDTFPKRLRFSDQFMITSTGLGVGNNKFLKVDFVKFTDSFGTDAEDPNTLITRALEILYRVTPTQAMLTYLKMTILLDGQVTDHYWTDAWLAYKSSPTTTNFNIVNTRLQKFYTFIVRNPEYQLA